MVLRRLSVHVRNVPARVRPLSTTGRERPLAHLRAATHALHERLDSSPWLDAATRDLAAYARHIAGLEAFYQDAESALAPHAHELTVHRFAPAERSKTPVLTAERAALRERGFPAEAGIRGTFPLLATLSAAVGCCYVLEGSTLGGTLIAQRVNERLGWESRFYGVYGPRTAQMWRGFAAATDALADELDDVALIAAALAVYDAYAVRIAGFDPAAIR